MPLEDFFTLTEMKDGLATRARVEELVGVMKEKENIIKNAGDAARQWSTVASILAATENKDCLNHFVELDGPLFLAQWLQEAQKCDSDTSDSFLEESINALLRALEKLPIDNEQSTASGIEVTVRNLLGHKSIKVQERARALFGSWNQANNENKNGQDLVKDEASLNDEPESLPNVKLTAARCPNSPVLNVSPFKESAEGSCVGEPADREIQRSKTTKGSDDSQLAITNVVKLRTSAQDIPLTNLNQADADGFPSDANSSGFKESSPCLGDVNGKPSNATGFKDVTDGMKEVGINMNVKEGSPSEASEEETCEDSESCKLKEPVTLPASPRNSQKSVMEGSISCHNDAKENESSPRKTLSSDVGSDNNILECKLENAGLHCGMPSCSSHIIDLKPVGEDGECHAESMPDLSCDGSASRTIDSQENSLHGNGAFETVDDDVKELVSESNSEASEGENSIIPSDISEPMMDPNGSNELENRKSDMELDYGVDDALEVARQVAKEVEREVVDYRGPFCCSPERNSEGEIMQTDCPDAIKVKQDEPMMEHLNEVKGEPPTEKHLCSDASSPEAKRSRMSGKTDAEPEDRRVELEPPSSTAVAQEVVGDTEKGKCDFDLNEEVFTEEVECLVVPVTNQPFKLSAPIPVVASSKGNPGLLSTPLHFEGELGWKGSASTSAFRPASPRRTLEGGDKISSVDVSNNGSKQKQSFLKIDLNVAGDENDAADLASAKHVHISSGLLSRESSVEVSSRTAERLKLDLNRLGDGDDGCTFPSSDCRVDRQFHHQNGQHGQSTASSSSSRKPPMIDFDLNDNPLVLETRGSHDHWQNLGKSSLQEVKDYGSFKLDDPVVSIMGSRVDINRKEFYSQTHAFLANGQGADASFSYSLARLGGGSGTQPSLGYAHPPPQAFGYNDLSVGSSLPFPLQMYGPTSSVPYMVGSRGATVIPQILGTAATIPTPSFSRPPFLMGLTAAPTGSPAVGGSGLDLNSGAATVDGESKDGGRLRQFFVHGHGGGPVEEQMRPSLQPVGMGVTLKRKEPECGWEPNMVGYKQEASWH